jgi:hypothetical protein
MGVEDNAGGIFNVFNRLQVGSRALGSLICEEADGKLRVGAIIFLTSVTE